MLAMLEGILLLIGASVGVLLLLLVWRAIGLVWKGKWP
jgi:hypothetical protein